VESSLTSEMSKSDLGVAMAAKADVCMYVCMRDFLIDL
jgi:hypothetical protein